MTGAAAAAAAKVWERWEAWPDPRRCAVLVALCLAVRLTLAWTSVVIETDGPVYIGVARDYASGDYLKALDHPYHPLYPLLIAVSHLATDDWERAGQLPGVLLSSLAILPIFFLARRTRGAPTALVAALLYAFSPYPARFAASVLTTGTYMTWLVFAAWLGTVGTLDRRPAWMFAAGLVAGLAYLTHVGGLVVFGALLGGLAVQEFLDSRYAARSALATALAGTPPPAGELPELAVQAPARAPAHHRTHLLSLALLVLAFVLTAAPYIGFIRWRTGTWNVSKKVTFAEMEYHAERLLDDPRLVARESTPPGSAALPLGNLHRKRAHVETPWQRLLVATQGVLVDFTQSAPQLLLPFFLLGLVALGKRWAALDRLAETYLVAFAGANVLPLSFFAYMYQRVSKRYTTPILVLLLPLAGFGLLLVSQGLARARARETGPGAGPATGPDARTEPWRWSPAAVVLLLLVLVGLSLKTFKPIGEDKRGEREAGEWIAAHAPRTPPRVWTQMGRVGWYARADHVPLRATDRYTPARMAEEARARDVDFIVVDRHVEGTPPAQGEAPADGICPGFLAWAEGEGSARLQRVETTSKLIRQREAKDDIYVFAVVR
ncbi:MAG: glycosyltransferase family 39 protein [Planctomycetes bacterium]|nr:glycosyltransferase family 39 protein [Planctomycetota bacterium]